MHDATFLSLMALEGTSPSHLGSAMWDLAGFLLLEELVNTAAAQASGSSDLADRPSGVVGRYDRPEALAFGVCEPCSCQLESGLLLAFMPDMLSECVTSFHALRIRVCDCGVQHTRRENTA